MPTRIIGLDCATVDSKIGLALGECIQDRVTLLRAIPCSDSQPAGATVVEWVRSSSDPVLIAIDAPLGWPVQLRRALQEHRAGDSVAVRPDQMFHRATDDFVRQT